MFICILQTPFFNDISTGLHTASIPRLERLAGADDDLSMLVITSEILALREARVKGGRLFIYLSLNFALHEII
jgi:hypothetical protein